jgi:hypothetical protein
MPQEVRFFVLVFFVVSLNHVAASSATSSYYDYPRRLLDYIRVPSFNTTSKVTHTAASKLRPYSNQGAHQIGHVSFKCLYYNIFQRFYLLRKQIYRIENLILSTKA